MMGFRGTIVGRTWTNNEAMLVLFEVLQLVEHESVSQTSLESSVLTCIEQVLQQIDPYSHYLSPVDYQAYIDSQKSNYAGIGVELLENPDGRILLEPYAGSPAEIAGIVSGNELIAVGQESIAGKSVYQLSAQIRGEAGSKVRLFVRRADSSVVSLNITRAAFHSSSVTSGVWEKYPTLKIREFTATTVDDLKKCLAEFPDRAVLILDLRGNTGGDLMRAIDCASLFLEAGDFIVRIATVRDPESYTASERGPFADSEVFLLQDSQTASAAEVFVSALIHNMKASTWGTRTFGKAVTQRIFPMSNGGALVLTNAELKLEDDLSWNQLGIEPAGTLDELLHLIESHKNTPPNPQPRGINP